MKVSKKTHKEEKRYSFGEINIRNGLDAAHPFPPCSFLPLLKN
jgi:hypothetical protein